MFLTPSIIDMGLGLGLKFAKGVLLIFPMLQPRALHMLGFRTDSYANNHDVALAYRADNALVESTNGAG